MTVQIPEGHANGQACLMKPKLFLMLATVPSSRAREAGCLGLGACPAGLAILHSNAPCVTAQYIMRVKQTLILHDCQSTPSR